MLSYPILKPFIVHGHDHAFRDEVLSHLKSLGMLDPVVLDGIADAGKTVIEKFEAESAACNMAVVLLTPDDKGTTLSGDNYNTARPNVWIELGYFMARFGRKTGRIVLIYKKGLDIPTDLSGVLYIDATDGIKDQHVARRLLTELDAIAIFLSTPPVSMTHSVAIPTGDLRIEGVVRLTN